MSIRTTTVSLGEMCKATGRDDLQEAANGFYYQLTTLGRKFSIWLPAQVQLVNTAGFNHRLTFYDDTSGALTEWLGSEYAHGMNEMLMLKEWRDVNTGTLVTFTPATFDDATHVLVRSLWALDQPLAPGTLETNQKRLGALYSGHDDLSNAGLGEDFWLLPISALPESSMSDLQQQERVFVTSIRCWWRMFDLQKSYYRKQMEAVLWECEGAYGRITLEDDYIMPANYEPGSLDLHKVIWYDEGGLHELERLVFTYSSPARISDPLLEMLLSTGAISGMMIVGRSSGERTTERSSGKVINLFGGSNPDF